jgi:hypothetical protein
MGGVLEAHEDAEFFAVDFDAVDYVAEGGL